MRGRTRVRPRFNMEKRMKYLYVNGTQIEITDSNAEKLVESDALLEQGDELILNPQHAFVYEEVEILMNPGEDHVA